jgi:hypothetical protein
MCRRWLIVICLTTLSACSTVPDPACPAIPDALTAPEPPLAKPGDLKAPLSQRDAFIAWMEDIRRFSVLRERHAMLADAALSCGRPRTPS